MLLDDHVHSNSSKRRALEEKAIQIQQLLEEPEVDLWKLRGLAITEGGLLNDMIRKKAWPKLVGLHQRFWEEQSSQHYPTTSSMNKSCEGSDSTPIRSNSQRGNSQRNTTPRNLKRTDEGVPYDEQQKRKTRYHSDDDATAASCSSLRDKVLASSLDARQIELDVARCTWHLLTGSQRAQRMQLEQKLYRRKGGRAILRLIRRKQRRLSNLINLTLVQSYRRGEKKKDNTLRYYQGYHDVACIVLSTLSGNTPVRLIAGHSTWSLPAMAAASGLDLPAAVLLQISQAHLRDSMRANFMHLQTTLRLVLFPLLAYVDAPVHEHLAYCEMEPFFALSWVITWFAHEIRDTELTKRLFDFFLVSHPLMPLYVSVAMISHPLNRQDVLQTECDFALVHQTLAALPRNSSMVGWKYQPGDGYVSDDEEDDLEDDDNDDSFCVSSQGSVDTEFLLQEEARRAASMNNNDSGVEAVSVSMGSSSMSTFADARVPFQDLLDTAVGLMKRMPPRNLLKLATRYYGQEFVDDAVTQAPEVFHDPPAWTTCAVSKSDQTLKLETHKEQQQTDASESFLERTHPSLEEGADQRLTFQDPIKAAAAVAAGVAPGDDYERRRNRRKRTFMAGAVAVAVVAIGVGRLLQAQQQLPVAPVEPLPTILATAPSSFLPERDAIKDVLTPTPEVTHFLETDSVLAVRELKVDVLVSGLMDFLLQKVLLAKLMKPLSNLQRVSKQLTNGWRRILRRRLRGDDDELLRLAPPPENGQCDWPRPTFVEVVDPQGSLSANAVCVETEDPAFSFRDATHDVDIWKVHPVVRGLSDLAGHLQRLPLHKLVNFVQDRKQEVTNFSFDAVHSAISEASVPLQYTKTQSSTTRKMGNRV